MRAFDHLSDLLIRLEGAHRRHSGRHSAFVWIVLPLALSALTVIAQGVLFKTPNSVHTYATLYFAVATSALLGGYRAAIIASVTTAASALWLFHPGQSASDLTVFAIFIVNCVLITGICHAISIINRRAVEAQAEAQRALQLLKGAQLFRLFIEHAPAALALFDKDLRCLAASRRWMDNYGSGEKQPGSTLDGKPASGMPQGWSEAQRRALAGGITRKEEDLVISPDGREQWLRWEVHPWRDTSGSVAGVVVFSENITAQKRAVIALEESELRLRAIVGSVEYAMIVTDRHGNIESLNSATSSLFGYSEAELLGRHVNVIVRGNRAGETALPGQPAMASDGLSPVGPGVEGLRKDGKRFPIDYMATEWNDIHGETHRTITIHDISERQAVDEELARAGRMEAIGRLAGGIAHDFGNLLAIIIGNLELALPRIRETKTRVMTRKALEAAARGAGFTRQLLTLARKRPSEFEEIDLNQHVSSMAILLEHTLGCNVRLDIDLTPDLWFTRADPVEVDSMIINLVMNASHAMPNGGVVCIETSNVTLGGKGTGGEAQKRSGEFVQISVRDTGTGMTKEVLQHAFEPFFTTGEEGVGTGLGLSSVYIFAQSCGGFVTIESSVGKGTTVEIHLPRFAGSERKLSAKAARPVRARGHGEVILVVEDNKGVREVTIERLERLGYITRSAETVGEACQILREDRRIALVFSDIVLVGAKTGYDIARWVERNRPEVRILLTTSYDIGDRTSAGDATHPRIRKLNKPYSTTRLANEIRRSLDAEPS